MNFIQYSAQRICSDAAVSLQLIGDGEVLLKLVAPVWFLSGVSPHVFCQAGQRDESCAAVLTLVRFLPSVNS